MIFYNWLNNTGKFKGCEPHNNVGLLFQITRLDLDKKDFHDNQCIIDFWQVVGRACGLALTW